MVMGVVPEMRRPRHLFVLAIRCRGRPGELDGQDEQQQYGQPATHARIVSLLSVGVCSAPSLRSEIVPGKGFLRLQEPVPRRSAAEKATDRR